MARRLADVPPVVFSGPAGSPEAIVDVPSDSRQSISVELSGPDGMQPVRALTAAAGAGTLVRLVIPESTAAGSYDAVVQVGDLRYPGTVEVPEQTALEAVPSTLDLVATDGVAPVRLTLVNTGNVPIEVRGAYAFGLLEERALEAAIGAGLRDTARGVDRLGRMADEVADRHAGLIRVAVTEGAGTLEPDQRVQVVGELRLGDKAQADHRYTGTWPIGPLRLAVAVRVSAAPVTRPRRTKSKGAK